MDETGQTAERIRGACIAAALEAYEDAGIQGLCAEGRWEAALSAMRRVDLRGLRSSATGLESADDGSLLGSTIPTESPSDG